MTSIGGACLVLSACTVWGEEDSQDDLLGVAQATLTAQATQVASTPAINSLPTTTARSLEPNVVPVESGWSIGALVWSPDGSRLAAAANPPRSDDSSDHRVYVWSADGELFKFSEDFGSDIPDLAWSADSQRLAAGGSDGSVLLWNTNGELQDTLAVSDGTIRTISWSPNENLLAVGATETTHEQEELAYYVYLLQPDGKVIARLDGGRISAGAYGLDWSPDGSLLVGGAVDFYAWTPRGAEVFSVSPGLPAWRTKVSVEISPDGQYLVIGNASTGINLYSMRGDHLGAVTGPSRFSLSPDGSTVALVSTALIQLAPLDALDAPDAHIPSGSTTNIVWSPDSEWLATGIAGAVSLWDLSGTRLVELQGCDGSATVLGLSPDGATLAAGYDSGQICLWEVAKASRS